MEKDLLYYVTDLISVPFEHLKPPTITLLSTIFLHFHPIFFLFLFHFCFLMWFINLIYLPNVVSKDIIKRKMYFMDFYILYFIVCVCVCICVSCLLEKANMIKIKINNNIRRENIYYRYRGVFCCCFVCKLELCWVF